MQRIPLTAHAHCVDGPSGDLAGLCVRADTATLEYYVVRDTTPGHAIERLVPRARVDAGETSDMRLDCTQAELGKMRPLNVEEFQAAGSGKSSATAYGHAGGFGIADAERAPDGTGVLRATQQIEAKNGQIGTLTGIVVDDEGRITHFYAHLKGRGSGELFVPVSAVWYVDRWTVYLKLDKQQLEALPALPALSDKQGVASHTRTQLVARVFDSPGGASEALDYLHRAQHGADDPIKILDAAVLVRAGDGPVRVEAGGKSSGRKGAIVGAAAGGLVALLGPVGLAAGAIAGGAVGGLAMGRGGSGLPAGFLDRLSERLKPEHSALVVLIQHDAESDPTRTYSVLEGAITHATIVDTLVEDMLTQQPTPP